VDLVTILFVTAAVLGVLLVVLAIIAVVVLLPPVRRAMRERAHDAETQSLADPSVADASEANIDAAGTDPQPASSNGAEPEQR
jgi:hypothetical protein